MSNNHPDATLDWVAPYLRPGAPVDGAGDYNRNFIVPRGNTTVVLRVPIPGAEELDFRVIPEADVLRVLEARTFPAPRLLHADPAGRFALHSFVPGTRLDTLYPIRAPLPDWVAQNVAGQLAALHALDPSPLQPFCAGIAAETDSAALLETLVAFTARSYAPLAERHQWLYARLHVPPDPLAVVRTEAKQLPSAPFALCHCDVHRGNLIAAPDAHKLTIIDWELALIADPALELGVHLHRIRYQPHQEDLFLETYLRLRGASADLHAWRARIDIYRHHEQVRSALVDVTRTVEDMREDLPQAVRYALVDHYMRKLVRAWEVWGSEGDPALLDRDLLLAVLEEAGRRLHGESPS
jgi:aminoglycoside phosphotransferase (APT) family kinase protein